ncbi:MAG: DUF1476 domain-containing protein [Pseudomonadota bacterium]
MSSTLEERERGFERKFAHDAEMAFKAEARRNRLLGEWAAEKMGITGEDIQAYAKEVIASDFEEPGDEDVYRKVSGDFETRGVTVAEAEIRDKMATLLAVAKAQLMEEHD